MKYKKEVENELYKSIIPSGSYWLGDPAYILDNKDYSIMLKEMKKRRGNINIFNIDSFLVLHINTIHGDGVFYDNKNKSYVVDSGQLILIKSTYKPKTPPKNKYYTLYQKIIFKKNEDLALTHVDSISEGEKYCGVILELGNITIKINVP